MYKLFCFGLYNYDIYLQCLQNFQTVQQKLLWLLLKQFLDLQYLLNILTSMLFSLIYVDCDLLNEAIIIYIVVEMDGEGIL